MDYCPTLDWELAREYPDDCFQSPRARAKKHETNKLRGTSSNTLITYLSSVTGPPRVFIDGWRPAKDVCHGREQTVQFARELLVRSPPKNEGVLRTDTLQRSTKRGLLPRLPAISWPVKNREGQSRSECRHETSHKSERWTAIRTGGGEPPRLLQIGVGKGMARLIGPVVFATARVASVTISSVENLLIMGGCVVNAFFHSLLPSSFWTSRGRRCRPFFPPVFAFRFYRA